MMTHPTILLAEDDEDDRLLIRRSIEKARLLNPLQVVRDGEEAIKYLAGEDLYANRELFPLPFLLLLDLHMPRQNGFDVLTWIATQSDLNGLKIAVLTSSSDERDYARAMKLGAHSYFVKPGSIEEFVGLMLRLKGHWVLLDGDPQEDAQNSATAHISNHS